MAAAYPNEVNHQILVLYYQFPADAVAESGHFGLEFQFLIRRIGEEVALRFQFTKTPPVDIIAALHTANLELMEQQQQAKLVSASERYIKPSAMAIPMDGR